MHSVIAMSLVPPPGFMPRVGETPERSDVEKPGPVRRSASRARHDGGLHVERMFGWMARWRPLGSHRKRRRGAAEAIIHVAMDAVMLRRAVRRCALTGSFGRSTEC
jgi:hypothetical protein